MNTEQLTEKQKQRIAEAERQEREELEATKRFMEKMGMDINMPKPDPKQPDPLQARQDAKEMIGMFQQVNGGENNPDVYFQDDADE